MQIMRGASAQSVIGKIFEDISKSLEPGRDPASSRAHAAAAATSYRALAPTHQDEVIKRLAASEFDADLDAIKEICAATNNGPENKSDAWKLVEKVRAAATSRRHRLFTFLNGTKDGLRFLINLRERTLVVGKDSEDCKNELAAFEAELRAVLLVLLDIGFIKLARITWDSPASLLEKLKQSEAVHEMRSWEDLKARVGDPDRRIFCFFHHSLPDEPIAFVEVALVNGLADNIHHLIDAPPGRAKTTSPDTAIFYSITAPLKGLDGITFGNFLIKKVISETNRNFPHISTFATLSPIPGFNAWLKDSLPNPASPLANLEPAVRTALQDVVNKSAIGDESVLTESVRIPLLRACAIYLFSKKAGNTPLDKVQRFHLGNGAMIGRLNWRADVTKNGLRQSAGLMVNYIYALNAMEANHMAYETSSAIAASESIRALLHPHPLG
ncbi:MAG: malonyl-CoA decarboxylase family protein [Magnetospirillum sp.]|nr:malonyl-CoA decarboxylase family protein [Magnetospirillum sp.]